MDVTTALSRTPQVHSKRSQVEDTYVSLYQGSDFQVEDTCVSLYQGSDFRVEDNASTLGEESTLRDANTLVKVTPPVRIKLKDVTTALNMAPRAHSRRSQFEDTTNILIKGSNLCEVYQALHERMT